MWGRLLMLALGAVLGVVGKTIYDDQQASSSGSTYSKSSTSGGKTESKDEAAAKGETDSEKEAD